MELLNTFCGNEPFTLTEYMALQRSLLQRFLAQGGTEEEFCRRLAPVFRRRYGARLCTADEMATAA